MQTLDVAGLRLAMAAELERRRCAPGALNYARERGGPEDLYGLTGAINVMVALGLPLGDRQARAEAAARIMAWRRADGTFDGGSGPGHAAHMVIGTLNLLGEPVPADIGPLAPDDPARLSAWLDRHDWNSTHKGLCGQTIPLLASGRVGSEWREVFSREVAARLSDDRPLELWCGAGDQPWRVISCVFHVLSSFDAGCLPYPRPDLLIRRLFDLRWEEADDGERRTCCTDGDWAWLLLRLIAQSPCHAERAMQLIRKVSARRVRLWNEDRERWLADDTHALYCHLWSTAVFQSCTRDHYAGGYVYDTFNQPVLFRL